MKTVYKVGHEEDDFSSLMNSASHPYAWGVSLISVCRGTYQTIIGTVHKNIYTI